MGSREDMSIMLDIPSYRMHEEMAKSSLPTWWISQRHNLELFEKGGFPVRISMLSQLRQVVDTMHENRFDAFMREIGGLTNEEAAALIRACQDLVLFQRLHFPNHKPLVPLSTLFSVLLVAQKLKALKPNFRSVLEIGAGCGYLPLFLRLHQPLENYTQIEACETFYLFQHYVNQFLFGDRFEQNVYLREVSWAKFYVAELANSTRNLRPSDKAERTEEFCQAAEPKLAYQYPWWNIGALAESATRFDIVVSNANLLELTPAALEDYLTLIDEKLERNGVFFVQCLGSPAARDTNYLWQTLYTHGFAPIFLTLGGTTKGADEWTSNDNFLGATPGDPRPFALANAVFVNRQHEAFRACYHRDNFRNGFYARVPGLREAFFQIPGQRRSYSKTDIMTLLQRASGRPEA
jgi:hypothetical protein